MLAVLPLFLLLRGWSWKTLRGWGIAIIFTVGTLIPFGAYSSWFHARYSQFDTPVYSTTLSEGFYLWGRVSSFADCSVIKPTGLEAVVCPTQPIVDRDPPGNYIWHAPYVHADMDAICTVTEKNGKTSKTCGPVSPAGNKVLTDFAIKAVEAQPLDYVKTVVKDVLLSFGFPRIGYPGSGTTYYYNFHEHYVGKDAHTGKPISLLPPNNPDHEWIPGGTAYSDWLSYGHQAPGVVHKIAAAPIAVYQRVVFTYGPLLAIIFLVGLGGLFSVTGRRQGKGVRSVLSAETLALAAPALAAARHLDAAVGHRRRAAGVPDRDRGLRLPLPDPGHPVRGPGGRPVVRPPPHGAGGQARAVRRDCRVHGPRPGVLQPSPARVPAPGRPDRPGHET